MGLKLFKLKKSALIGVEVDSSHIKMVELNKTSAGIVLERFAIERIAPGIVIDGEVVSPEGFKLAIEKCYETLGSKVTNLALSLPMGSVFIKKLSVSSDLQNQDLEQEVAKQLSMLMSIDMNEISVDFQIVPMSSEDDEVPDKLSDNGFFTKNQVTNTGRDADNLTLLTIAVKKERIDQLVAPFEEAGLNAVIVDSESFAMHTALQEFLERDGIDIKDKNHAFVNIVDDSMVFVVLRNAEVIYTRGANFGINQMVNDTVMQFGISDVEARKIIFGQIQVPNEFDALIRSHVESATQEVQRSMLLFTTSTSYVDVQCLYLHGEGSMLVGLPENVSQVLGVSCEVFNPFKGLEISGLVSKSVDQHASSLIVACGLAFRRFDL